MSSSAWYGMSSRSRRYWRSALRGPGPGRRARLRSVLDLGQQVVAHDVLIADVRRGSGREPVAAWDGPRSRRRIEAVDEVSTPPGHPTRTLGGATGLHLAADLTVRQAERRHGPHVHRRRGGVPGRGPGLARGERPGRAAAVRRHPRGLRPPPRVGAAALRRPLVGGVVARGVRRPRRDPLGVADLRGGVLPGRRARSGSPRTASSCSRPTIFEFGTPEQQDRFLPQMASGEDRGARAGPSPTPAATSPASRAGPTATTRPAAGGSTARRPGRPAARSAPTSSACSAPTRRPSATAGSPTSSSRSTPPGVTVRGLRPARRRRGLRRGVLRGRVRPRRPRARRGRPGLERRDGDDRLGARPHAAQPRPVPRRRRPARSSSAGERAADADATRRSRHRVVAGVHRRRGVPALHAADRDAHRRRAIARRRVEPHQDLLVRARRAPARDRARACSGPTAELDGRRRG